MIGCTKRFIQSPFLRLYCNDADVVDDEDGVAGHYGVNCLLRNHTSVMEYSSRAYTSPIKCFFEIL